jgi:MutS domain V
VAPLEHYSQRLREREAHMAQLERLHARIGSMRLALGAAFLLMLWLCFGIRLISPLWIFLPMAGFILVVLYHYRVRARQTAALRAATYYRLGLGRLTDRWSGHGPNGKQYEPAHHLYAADLDLFGEGSLFQLLCAARTQMGEFTLAQWLLAPAAADVVRQRQAGIGDLADRLMLREEFAIEGSAARIELHTDTLTKWAEATNLLDRSWIPLLGVLLGAGAVAGVLVWAIWDAVFPLLAVLLLEVGVTYLLRNSVTSALKAVEGAYADLRGIALILSRFEAESFDAAPLLELQHKLASHGASASHAISKLATIVNFVEARRNSLLAPLMLLLMYPLLTAVAAERWRKIHGSAVRSWLAGLGEIEALLSLARYRYERPQDTLAEFAAGAATFRAEGLGHPLIPAAARICNDVDISGLSKVLLVSGSNMSGKSTLLRTIGINTVLAMAGAPVLAKRLTLTALQVGASIRVNDSLQEGSSRFYAEITHLRQLFEPCPLPMLFLLDELLQGTNSADRRVGAQGILRALLQRGAIGLVSTHDLALTDIAGLDEHALVNVHFQDELKHGKLSFDFKLHPGIVTKSNGIELMRSIGLDV